MDVNGAPTGVWGTCLVSQCGTKVPCTDAGGPPECADGGLPGFPGYGLAYNDCLLCNPDAGVPPAPAKHDSSGCSVVGSGPSGVGWWLGAAVLLLLGVQRRGWGRR
jgi:hypothetical protein